jgi:replication factor C small subunit
MNCGGNYLDWNNAYRPKNLDEYIGQDYIREKILILSEQIHEGKRDFPHLLFSGSHGTGKTSMVYAFLKHTLGDEWDFNFHEINSSTMGNIETVRTQISEWCSNQTLGHYETPDGRTMEIPYTIIFLDEVDGMSRLAQFALRRVMEDYNDVRFVLSCNFIHKVLPPIIDRTMHFHFPPYRAPDLVTMMSKIVENEKIPIGRVELELIAEHSNGSARRAQKILQKVSLTRENITADEVMRNIHTIDEDFDIKILMEIIEVNAGNDAKQYFNVHNEFANIVWQLKEQGYSGEDIIIMMFNNLKDSGMDLNTQRYFSEMFGKALYKCNVVTDVYTSIELWARSLGLSEN